MRVHPRLGGGLLPTGSGRLLGSQTLGALVLAALGCGGAAAAAGTLRLLGDPCVLARAGGRFAEISRDRTRE